MQLLLCIIIVEEQEPLCVFSHLTATNTVYLLLRRNFSSPLADQMMSLVCHPLLAWHDKYYYYYY